MFTGLVATQGKVTDVTPRAGVTRLGVRAVLDGEPLVLGESIAVDGVCLSVTEVRRDRFFADVIPETLQRTTLGGLRRGSSVNLERALRAGDRLGGHLVQGHVDGVGQVRAQHRNRGDERLSVGLPEPLRRYIAYKGSVALQGVSLTVSAVDPLGFEVALIPHTLEHTTLGQIRVGDSLNVEVDLLARYLERLIQRPRNTEERP